jgi:hypothetical protein
MLEHERRFRRIKGYQHLPLLPLLPLLARALATGHIEITEATSRDAAGKDDRHLTLETSLNFN